MSIDPNEPDNWDLAKEHGVQDSLELVEDVSAMIDDFLTRFTTLARLHDVRDVNYFKLWDILDSLVDVAHDISGGACDRLLRHGIDVDYLPENYGKRAEALAAMIAAKPEGSLRPIPTNPQTYTDKGEPL